MKTNVSVLTCNHDGLLISGPAISNLRQTCDKFTATVDKDGAVTISGTIDKRKYINRIVSEATRAHADFIAHRRVITCMVVKNGRTCVGNAVCAPDDYFDTMTGRAIAYLRAVGKPVPQFLVTA